MNTISTSAASKHIKHFETKQFIAQYGIVLAFIGLFIVLSFANQYFLTWNNLSNVLQQVSINGILAVGMTYVILTKGIDLSVGSIVAVTGMVAASFATTQGVHAPSLLLSIGVALSVGALLGAINGFVIARLAIPPFVATLGMLSAARGLTFIYNDGSPIPGLLDSFAAMGKNLAPVAIFIAVVALFWIILKYTVYGRYIYAVGGNERSAKTSGINTKRMIFSVYVVSGVLAAVAGLILTARTGTAVPQAAASYELDAIAAVVIGGASLSGGRGSLIRTVFGVLIIGIINNGLDLMGVSSYYQQVIKGVIIVCAVLLDGSRKQS